MGWNSTVGARSFPARKTGVCYGCGAGAALGSQQSIHAISCLEPKTQPPSPSAVEAVVHRVMVYAKASDGPHATLLG